VVDKIPNEFAKKYVKTMPQTISLRPHIKNGLLAVYSALLQSRDEPLSMSLKRVSKLTENLFEVGRILGIDINTMSQSANPAAKYNDSFHIINNYELRFNSFMKFFKKLFFDNVLSSSNGSVLETVLEVPAVETAYELFRECVTLVHLTTDRLLEEFQGSDRVEELDGGKRKRKGKTRRGKTRRSKKRRTKTRRRGKTRRGKIRKEKYKMNKNN